MILIYGFGTTGKAVARFCEKKGFDYLVVDRHPQTVSSPFYLEGQLLPFDRIKKVVLSPGVRPSVEFEQECAGRLLPMMSEVEFALPWIKNRMIGVSGTNGKSSTVLLMAHLLQRGGYAAIGCGNLGRPLIDFVDEPEPWLIVELSSFQLERTYTPFLERSILLNIEPNHLDHHASMEEYCAAKLKILSLVKPGGKSYRPYEKLSDQVRLLVEQEKLNHRFHDPWQIQLSKDLLEDMGFIIDLERDLPLFEFPPYRLAYRGDIEGVSIYNDSKSTTPAATLFALEQLQKPSLLLVGGSLKNTPFECWRDYFPQYVKKVFAFGRSADTIKRALEGIVVVIIYETLEEAVAAAWNEAERGDSLLFSPGCASYDQFAHYRERGAAFDACIRSLVGGGVI